VNYYYYTLYTSPNHLFFEENTFLYRHYALFKYFFYRHFFHWSSGRKYNISLVIIIIICPRGTNEQSSILLSDLRLYNNNNNNNNKSLQSWRMRYICDNMTVHRNVQVRLRDAVKILKTKSRQIFSTSTSKMNVVEPPCGCYDKSTEETIDWPPCVNMTSENIIFHTIFQWYLKKNVDSLRGQTSSRHSICTQ